ncbi:hypothetical protein LLEC1_00207, partial [Akanthomyces lecanii]
MVSCSCVPVDPMREKIAIIYDRISANTQLPNATGAMPTVEMMSKYSTLTIGLNGLTEGFVNCEPCSSASPDTGKGDSTDKPDEAQERPGKMALGWNGLRRDTAARMSAAADGRVIEKVLADMCNTGYDI